MMSRVCGVEKNVIAAEKGPKKMSLYKSAAAVALNIVCDPGPTSMPTK